MTNKSWNVFVGLHEYFSRLTREKWGKMSWKRRGVMAGETLAYMQKNVRAFHRTCMEAGLLIDLTQCEPGDWLLREDGGLMTYSRSMNYEQIRGHELKNARGKVLEYSDGGRPLFNDLWMKMNIVALIPTEEAKPQ